MPEQTHLGQLLTGAASALRDSVALPVSVLHEKGGEVSRATLAAALNLHLLAGLLERVPSGRAYMDDLAEAGRKLVFDHGAMRTVAMENMGTLPAGLARTSSNDARRCASSSATAAGSAASSSR